MMQPNNQHATIILITRQTHRHAGSIKCVETCRMCAAEHVAEAAGTGARKRQRHHVGVHPQRQSEYRSLPRGGPNQQTQRRPQSQARASLRRVATGTYASAQPAKCCVSRSDVADNMNGFKYLVGALLAQCEYLTHTPLGGSEIAQFLVATRRDSGWFDSVYGEQKLREGNILVECRFPRRQRPKTRDCVEPCGDQCGDHPIRVYFQV